MKEELYTIPTSKLIYYRYFKESDYKIEEIDRELKRRNYVTFKQEKERADKLITRKLVSIEYEEYILSQRGSGLENYIFDTTRTLYITLDILTKEKKDDLSGIFNTLTFSEQSILNYLLKNIIEFLIYMVNHVANIQDRYISRQIIDGLDLLDKNITQKTQMIGRILTEYKLLLATYKKLLNEFNDFLSIERQNKLDRISDQGMVFFKKSLITKTYEAIIPNRFVTTIWEELIRNINLEKELKYYQLKGSLLLGSLETLKEGYLYDYTKKLLLK